jgi:hypothetical protein
MGSEGMVSWLEDAIPRSKLQGEMKLSGVETGRRNVAGAGLEG